MRVKVCILSPLNKDAYVASVLLTFEGVSIGATPTGWAKVGANSSTLTAVADASGTVLRLANPGGEGPGSGHATWRYTAGPEGAPGEVMEVVALVRRTRTNNASQYALGVRATATENFAAGFGVSPDETIIGSAPGATSVRYGSTPYVWTGSTWYRVRLRAEGTNAAMSKVWADGAEEPAAWTLTASSGATLTDRGFAALTHVYALASAAYVDVLWMGISTGGDSAPMPTPPMPDQLVLGGVTVKLQAFSVLPSEQGGGDWSKRNWSVKVVMENDAEASALRTAIQAATARQYTRAINGALRNGPLVNCSGDRLGATISCGIEVGEQPLEITGWVRSTYHHTLSLTLREA